MKTITLTRKMLRDSLVTQAGMVSVMMQPRAADGRTHIEILEQLAHDIFDSMYPTESTIHVTEREREVVQGVWDGLTSKEIGVKFNCTAKTVENHRYNLMKKLGARSVATLLRCSLQQKIIFLP